MHTSRARLRSGIGMSMALAISALACGSANAVFYNIGSGFSATSNPTADGIWRYGWSQSLTSPMVLYTNPGTLGALKTWNDAALGALPNVGHNPTNQLQGTWPPSTVGLHPGPGGQYSRVRFTAPETNIYYIALEFTGLDDATSDVHVIQNNSLPTLFSGEVIGSGSIQEFFPPGIVLAQNDTIDFVVGYGSNQDNLGDTTAVFTTINKGCLADLNGGGSVDVDDLLAVINAWGPCEPKQPCPDIAPPGGNGAIDVDDLLAVINAWGACD